MSSTIDEFLTRLFPKNSQIVNLEAEMDRYRRIFEASHGYGFVDWDMEMNHMFWHGGYWRSLGYDQQDMESISDPEKFMEFVHPDDRENLSASVLGHLKQRGDRGVIFRLRKKSGGHVWTEVRVDSVRDSTGWAKYVSGIVFDVTLLKQTEQALLVSEARHSRIIQASNDGIWEWSVEDGGFHFSHRCWEQLGFRDNDDFLIENSDRLEKWRERMHPDDGIRFDSMLNDHIRKKSPFDLEYRIRGKDGGWRWIRARGQMTYNEKGEPSRMSGTNMDVTDLKEAQQEVLEAKDGAEKANQAKSEFLSGMSHELRTPLNAILGFAQLFDLDHNLTEDQRDNIREIKNAGRHLLKLVGDVLDLAKIEAGKTEFAFEAISPIRLLKSCINLLRSQAEERNIDVVLDEDGFGHHTLRLDSIRLKQVFLNLMSNAIKYNRKSGKVKIFAEVDDNRMKISVEDTGRGIPQKFQHELFQPFNRLGAERTNVEGSGVGLVITKKITEQMGGEISFETELNVGTTFSVCFPILENESPYSERSFSIEMEHTGDDIPELKIQSQKRVLYVEDNPSNQRLMSQLLSKFPLLELDVVGQALKGLYAARTSVPDLIILDINLPGMDGFETVEVLKHDPITKDIPVIALSANALAHDIEKGKAAGFDFYLTKPVDLAQLIKVCNQLLVR